MQSKRIQVYLVDDDEDDRFLFSDALKRSNSNIDLVMFQEGTELLDHLNSSKQLPDVIFIDLNMPLVNGDDLLDNIRSGPHTTDVPIIIYSTSYNPRKAQNVLDKGASLFLQKPASFKELQKKIQQSIDSVLSSRSSKNKDGNRNITA